MLEPLNSGPELFARWARHGFEANWVGEPLVVMVRRELLQRAGGFNPDIRQAFRFDLDLWARIMPLCTVGFADTELADYRVPTGSLTIRNHQLALDWLDQLWTLESLRFCSEAQAAAPWLTGPHEAERRRVRGELRELFGRDVPARGTRLADAGRMAREQTEKRLRRGARPFPKSVLLWSTTGRQRLAARRALRCECGERDLHSPSDRFMPHTTLTTHGTGRA